MFSRCDFGARLGWFVVLMFPVVVLAGCGTAGSPETVSSGPSGTATSPVAPASSAGGQWLELVDPPLSGRMGAAVTAVSDRLLVAGGWDFTCPPGADCSLPESPPLADGAVFDPQPGTWSAIADAPEGLHDAATAVVGSDVYALTGCEQHPSCPTGPALFRYRADDDEWDLLAAPPIDGYFHLVSVADGVVAFSDSDEQGAPPDFFFDMAGDRWQELPPDPLPPVYDRMAIHHEGQLLVFGSPLEEGPPNKVGAALHLDTRTWERLPDSDAAGYQVWPDGVRLYLNPHFGDAEGGVLDLDTLAWTRLPEPPEATSWTDDMAGIIGHETSDFAYAQGWALDTATETWIEIPRRPGTNDVSDESVASFGRSLVVFGGQRWTGDQGEILNDTWLWTPTP